MTVAPRSIAIVVPVLRRPHRVRPLMDSVAAATTVPYRLLFVASPEDPAEQDALRSEGADFIVLDRQCEPGDWARKINAGYRATTEPVVFTGADDLVFHRGWDVAALRRLKPGIGVVGTNDMGNPRVMRGQHATHSLVTREYADHHGTVDGPGAVVADIYPHEFADDELVRTARWRKAWAFAADSKVEHMHPHWGKGPTDDIYDAAPERLEAGRVIFNARRHLWGERVAGTRPAPSSTSQVTVIVATFGDDEWAEKARTVALPSVAAQRAKPAAVIHVHGSTLAAARNEGAERADSPWLCFLDADDELHPNYLAAMKRVAHRGELLNPAVQYVEKRRSPRLIPSRPLRSGNYLVIGTAVKAELFHRAGGFWEEPAWEDWSLWLRCDALGARVVRVPQAVYIAHVREHSRNDVAAGDVELRASILAAHDLWLADREGAK